MSSQLTPIEVSADRKAEATLLGAVAIGCLAAILRLLTEDALTPVAVGWAWVLLPPALILAAALVAAPAKRGPGSRQQGALLVLAGLAALSIPFTAGMPFSPIYGIALLLLAARTRYTPTAVVGMVTLLGAVMVGFLSAQQAVVSLALLAAAAGANAIQTWRAARA